jgi:ribulose 1,5-bisphosphate synthetase/thiazole synthase
LGIVITDGDVQTCPRSAITVPTSEFDIAIIGGGPAGLTAALYAGRNRERAVLLEG